MRAQMTKETLDLARAALEKPNEDILRTAGFWQPGTATSGLIGYDLEAPAKHLIPVITPLRNKIPRDVSGFGTQANWQIITGINTSNVSIGVKEGARGGAISYSTSRKYAAYVECGLEHFVTFKADLASKNFMDVKAESQLQLLWSLMIREEFEDLGGIGLSASALGTTATPVVTSNGSTPAGTLNTSTTYYVGCVALNLRGYQQLAGVNMGITGQQMTVTGAGLMQQIARTNMDGSTDYIPGGTAIPAYGSGASVGATDSLTATVDPTSTPGAVAYAWYWGLSASLMYLGAVTAENFVIIKANSSSANQNYADLAATDYSYDQLVYDGILTQLMASGSGAYVFNVKGKLTTDGGAGITQINTAFQTMFDRYRTGPDVIYVNSQELLDMNYLVLYSGGAPLYRFQLDGKQAGGQIPVGVVIGSFLNKVMNKNVPVVVHPNLPPGTMLLWSDSVPYPLNDVGNLVKKKLRRDYYSIEWPIMRRRYEYGLYFDGVLQRHFPACLRRDKLHPAVEFDPQL